VAYAAPCHRTPTRTALQSITQARARLRRAARAASAERAVAGEAALAAAARLACSAAHNAFALYAFV